LLCHSAVRRRKGELEVSIKSQSRWAFILHRYLGLAVGLVVAIIGLTGSILVFYPELDTLAVRQQFGSIQPQGEPLPVTTLLNQVQAAFANRPEWKVSGYYPFWTAHPQPNMPVSVSLTNNKEVWLDAFVNPYTGEVLGTRQWDGSFFDFVFKLHYQLLAGDIGTYIAGVIAVLIIVLSVTGILLWPGWRRLIAGFKIKWKAHPKRVNFDLHKVTGIITVAFLAIIAFTGVCWNLPALTDPIIHAITLSPKHTEPVSKAVKGKAPLPFTETFLAKAEAALPGGRITYISLPIKPDATFGVTKHFPGDWNEWGDHKIYFDQYSGEIIKVETHNAQSRAERFTNIFPMLHYGYFGGLPTRIFYLFVGLAPTLLLITGFTMWRYRRRGKTLRPTTEAQPVLVEQR
jgi:uncharacterized iron-regulated membrane protein